MKKTQDILDLALICIEEGREYGKVKGLLVDPDSGKVEYLVIDDGQWYLGAKVLPFEMVLGIGINAVTTESESNIKNFGEVSEAVELARKDVGIIGTKVYTKKGKYLGTISEYYIDEENGSITGCELSGNEQSGIIPASSVVTYGKSVLVVVENVEDTLVSKLDDDMVNSGEPSVKKEEVQQKSSTENSGDIDKPEDVKQQDSQDAEEQGEKTAPAPGGDASKLFEQRQRQFLIGRKASKKIVDDSGSVLVEDGQVITGEIIDKIKASGKLVELTMNTRP